MRWGNDKKCIQFYTNIDYVSLVLGWPFVSYVLSLIQVVKYPPGNYHPTTGTLISIHECNSSLRTANMSEMLVLCLNNLL